MRLKPVHFALAVSLLGPVAELHAGDTISLAGGRFTIGGEVSASVAPEDNAFFNDTGYRGNTLRLARFSLAFALRPEDHIAVLADVRSEDFEAPRVYSLFLRLRPWLHRSFDIQAGMIPPVFGAFARRQYGVDNPLIGYPLAYQYLTILRTDAVPRSADELLVQRGFGWAVQYPIGSYDYEAGIPLAHSFRWDSGVEVRLGSRPIEVSASLTQGSLSNPLFHDDNDGKQLAGRVAWRPSAGLVLGLSGARGAYLGREALGTLPPGLSDRNYLQTAWGLDGEYSRDHWLVRGEAVWSRWEVPTTEPPHLDGPVGALGVTVEGRYKIAPGLYTAARIDHLGFSRIRGSDGYWPWDIPVWRVEIGGGYSITRNLLVKLSYQQNWRDGGPPGRRSLVAGQLLFRF